MTIPVVSSFQSQGYFAYIFKNINHIYITEKEIIKHFKNRFLLKVGIERVLRCKCVHPKSLETLPQI